MKALLKSSILITLFALASCALLSQSTCFSADQPELVLGKKVFERATCVGCHANGDNLLLPNHPIKGPKFQRRYKDDTVLEQVIRHGFPSAGMPGFPKHEINEKEMKALIAYVRSLTPKETTKER
jgi:mono/diheme cytochrome c family protein